MTAANLHFLHKQENLYRLHWVWAWHRLSLWFQLQAYADERGWVAEKTGHSCLTSISAAVETWLEGDCINKAQYSLSHGILAEFCYMPKSQRTRGSPSPWQGRSLPMDSWMQGYLMGGGGGLKGGGLSMLGMECCSFNAKNERQWSFQCRRQRKKKETHPTTSSFRHFPWHNLLV